MRFLKTLYFRWFPGSTIAHRLFWKYRYLFAFNKLDDYEVEVSIKHPHRQLIINELANFSGIERIVELGSSWGPNLFLINKNFPSVDCVGIDLSLSMTKAGNRFFKSKKINNIRLIQGDMTSLKRFKEGEFDFVLTDASLIYIDNKHILPFAAEMVRISKKGFILVEFDDESDDPYGYSFQTTWIRDYRALFYQYSDKIDKHNIDKRMWPGKWAEFGKIITVVLNKYNQ